MPQAEPQNVNLDDLCARIDAAQVYGLAKRTPTQFAPKLSAALGRNIWLKREDLQDVFSFKIRGRVIMHRAWPQLRAITKPKP